MSVKGPYLPATSGVRLGWGSSWSDLEEMVCEAHATGGDLPDPLLELSAHACSYRLTSSPPPTPALTKHKETRLRDHRTSCCSFPVNPTHPTPPRPSCFQQGLLTGTIRDSLSALSALPTVFYNKLYKCPENNVVPGKQDSPLTNWFVASQQTMGVI